MVFSTLLALSSIVLSVQAMLPSDIPSPFTQKVNFTATFGSYDIGAANSGTEIPLSIASYPPFINIQPLASQPYSNSSASSSYLIVFYDPDVIPAYHQALQCVFTYSPQKNITTYIGPQPPAGPAHRYTFVVYTVPSEFTPKYEPAVQTPTSDKLSRIKFDLTKFATENNLSEPVAAVYFNASAADTGIYNISANGSITAPVTPPPVQTSWAEKISPKASIALLSLILAPLVNLI